MSAGHEAIVDTLSAALEPAGFDVISPFRVDWYNAAIEPAYRLPELGRHDPLGVVIANSRALWPRFIATLAAEPARLQAADPLDDFTRDVIDAAVADLGVRADIRYVFEPPPRRLPFQRLAAMAGLAHLSQTYLCVHPTYGPWIGLRAAVVLDAPGPERRTTQQAPCDCNAGCRAAFERALDGDDWRAWVDVRDACPIGREHRYSDEQIEYHYVKPRELLIRAAAAQRKS